MTNDVKQQIQSLIDLETKGWDTLNPDLFLSIIHPDMAWPWPPDDITFDPLNWEFILGRFDYERWRKSWQDIFDTHHLIHNVRKTLKIQVSPQQDAAFAVVDIDTLWRHKETGKDSHWKGRTCKIYTKMPSGEWKFYFQTGALDYSRITIN